MKTKIIVPKNIYWLPKNSSYALNTALHLFTIFSLSSALLPKCIIIHQERGMYVHRASYVEYPYKIYMEHFRSTMLRKLYLLAIDWMLPLGTQCWSYFQFFCFGNVESASISGQYFRRNTSKAIKTRQCSKRLFIRMPSHIENSNKKLFCWSHFVYIPFWVNVYVCVWVDVFYA